MGNILQRNYKIIFGVVIWLLISVVGAYAATTLSSSDIYYDNSKSGLTSTNLNGAIDELYEKFNNKACKVLKGTGRNTNDEIICGTEEFYVLYPSGDSIAVLTKYPIEAGGAIVESREEFHGIGVVEPIENPSYAQNKDCGKENFKCGGTGFASKYKEVLNRIGLSDSIKVIKPSLSELNKAGCSFSLSPVYDQSNGSCAVLPWLEAVVLTDKMSGPTTAVVANANELDWLPAMSGSYLAGYEKLIVKIPINNILMS